MAMPAFLTEKQDAVAEICRAHHVRHLAVFGSAVREDFDPERSDVDVRVEFGDVPLASYAENYSALLDELEGVFGRKVDLLSRPVLVNRFFRHEVESTQVTFYEA